MDQGKTPYAILQRAIPGLPETEAQALVASGQVRLYPAQTVLCHEDAFESTFYILLSGEVEVTKAIDSAHSRHLKTLHAGDFFGEMALIHNAPRAATVKASRTVQVLEIRKEAFDEQLHRSASLSLAMARVVSERLRANDAMAIEDLRLKAAELALAYQRLAEQEFLRREFLTTIAHELRTPLTAANGFLQMIQAGRFGEGEASSAGLKTALDSVTRNVQQIVTLVNDILFLQEMDLILPRFQPTDLGPLLEGAARKLEAQAADNNVRLLQEIYPYLPAVLGDEKSLARAFSAILDNAIKFSPGGGTVNITTALSGGGVEVRVRDHGVGIPKEAQARVFDHFFHLDRVGDHLFRGAGLGLSIARQVIEQHHGEIGIQSALGEGSTVTVWLPSAG